MAQQNFHSVIVAVDIVENDRAIQSVQTFKRQDLKKFFIGSDSARCNDCCIRALLEKFFALAHGICKNKFTAVLIQEGYGEEGFTEAVLKREKDYPTGLDVNGIGVAIPHTDAEHVKKEGISIAVLNPPIEFDAMGEEDCRIPVKIVIMFTVAGKDKHIDRLLQILDMIKDEEILQGLLDAKNKKEIRTVIQKREKSDIN